MNVARAASIAFAIALIAASEFLVRDRDPIIRMLAIVTAAFFAMKVVVLAFERASLSLGSTIAFLFWPGMRPRVFAEKRAGDRGETRALVASGVRAFAAGAALFLSLIHI